MTRAPRGASGISRVMVSLACMASLVALSGAGCPQVVRQYKLPSVRSQARAITLDELVMRVNENNNRVHSLSCNDATLSGPRFPSLRANIALERPNHFRLVAEKTGLSGTELDLGSNEELFWFWVKRSEPPAIYFCRHDQFSQSTARAAFPVEPQWLIEALGLVSLHRSEITYGPAPVGNGRLRLELTVPGSEGPRRKVLVFDDTDATLVEEHLYDERGALVATALLSEHERDRVSGAMLPSQIEIQWPATKLEMKIQLHRVLVNQLAGDPAQLWSKPEYRGWANVDLADPRVQLPPAAQQVLTAPSEPLSSQAPHRRWFRRG